jgi:hypothetical protein
LLGFLFWLAHWCHLDTPIMGIQARLGALRTVDAFLPVLAGSHCFSGMLEISPSGEHHARVNHRE